MKIRKMIYLLYNLITHGKIQNTYFVRTLVSQKIYITRLITCGKMGMRMGYGIKIFKRGQEPRTTFSSTLGI